MKAGEKEKLSDGQQRLVVKIADRILTLQRNLADWLNVKTAKVSNRRWLVILMAFCMAFGSYFLWLLIAVFN